MSSRVLGLVFAMAVFGANAHADADPCAVAQDQAEIIRKRCSAALLIPARFS
jgi:hypothetical protein